MDIFKLSLRTETDETSLNYAIELGLLTLTNKQCPKCLSFMKLEQGKERHMTNKRFRCFKKKCRYSVSIWKNTIFHGTKLPIGTLIKIIYCFSVNMTVDFTFKQCKVNKNTVVKWFRFLREILYFHIFINNQTKIGGLGMTIEVDETHIHKRKFNVGRCLISESVWVVGGICRENKDIFLAISTKRDKNTLKEIIQNNINEGSTIITDCWKAYNFFGEIDRCYDHKQVNHKFNYVDPVDKTIHTQNVERLWRSLKQSLPVSCSRKHLFLYLQKFIFNQKYSYCDMLSKFDLIVEVIKQYYFN